MSSVVVINSQTSCSLIHLNPSQELGRKQPNPRQDESTPTRVAKRLLVFVPTVDSTSWVQPWAQVRKDRLSVETPAECLEAGMTEICTNRFKKRVRSLKQQRRTNKQTLDRKDCHRLNTTGARWSLWPWTENHELVSASSWATVSKISAAVGSAGAVMHYQFYFEKHNSWFSPGYEEQNGTGMFLNLLWGVSVTASKAFSLQAGWVVRIMPPWDWWVTPSSSWGKNYVPRQSFKRRTWYCVCTCTRGRSPALTHFRCSLILMSGLELFFFVFFSL